MVIQKRSRFIYENQICDRDGDEFIIIFEEESSNTQKKNEKQETRRSMEKKHIDSASKKNTQRVEDRNRNQGLNEEIQQEEKTSVLIDIVGENDQVNDNTITIFDEEEFNNGELIVGDKQFKDWNDRSEVKECAINNVQTEDAWVLVCQDKRKIN